MDGRSCSEAPPPKVGSDRPYGAPRRDAPDAGWYGPLGFDDDFGGQGNLPPSYSDTHAQGPPKVGQPAFDRGKRGQGCSYPDWTGMP